MPVELHTELWSHICSFLYTPPPDSTGRPGGSWRDLHQHDLTTLMRVNSTLHEAAALHLYRDVHLANLPSFFCGVNTPSPTNRSSKIDLLRLVRRMTLYNPRVTLPSSSRRQPSPTVFTIDPVYPYPDRKTLRLVDETLAIFAGLAETLTSWTGTPLLPQLEEFTSTSLKTDKWEPIEKYIMAGDKALPRYTDFQTTSQIVQSLIRHAVHPTRVVSRHWRFWPVSGPYTNGIAALADVSPPFTYATQFIDQCPTCLPAISKNTIVLVKPLIAEASFGRYLNWPDLRGRLRKFALDNSTKEDGEAGRGRSMEIQVKCRMVPNQKKVKEWGKIDSEVDWELDNIDEINERLDLDWNETCRSSIQLVWDKDAVVPEINAHGGEERRGR